MPTLQDIASPKMMSVNVSGPGDANRLLMFSGVAVFNWQHQADDHWVGWVQEPLRISMLGIPGVPTFYGDQVVDHTATAALASFSISETRRSDTWGLAVDEVEAFFTEDRAVSFADFGLNLQLALRGFATRMFRISFSLNVLARL